MGATVTRNSFKGMTFQECVYRMFVGIMDCDRDIVEVDSEINADHNFDDIKISLLNDISYFVQIKNICELTMDDIKVEVDYVNVGTKRIRKSNSINNVLFLNGVHNLSPNTAFLGIDACKINDIIVVSLTVDEIVEHVDKIYQSQTRYSRICNIVDSRITNGIFKINLNDLPPLETFQTKLEEELVRLRDHMKLDNKEIVCCVGKPGVGKSFFASEIENEYSNSVLYRFWVNSQDIHYQNRLKFDNFIADLGIKVLKSPKKFEIEELVRMINNSGKIFIFDGLDHVYNYNNQEFEKYIGFFDLIKDNQVIIMTRPLDKLPNWKQVNLENWSKKQTFKYLDEKYALPIDCKEQIYKLVKGYPILTKFLAQHYMLTKSYSFDHPIKSVNEYYEKLMSNVNMKTALSTLLISKRFVTKLEIEILLNDEHARLVNEFVDTYPYLFEIKLNRISFIHDSLNTYLFNLGLLSEREHDRLLHLIGNSIINGDTQFMGRFDTFGFHDDFKKKTIIDYSNICKFRDMMKQIIDFESVKEFYEILKFELEYHPGILSANQYYEFILITQILERNDLVGQHVLIRQHIKYLMNTGLEPKDINSSGLFWHIYFQMVDKKRNTVQQWFDCTSYDSKSNQIDIDEDFEKDDHFFDCIQKKYDFEKYIKYLESSGSYYDKHEDVINLLVNIFIFGCEDKRLEDHVRSFILDSKNHQSETAIQQFYYRFDKNDHSYSEITINFLVKLKKLGVINTKNIFLSEKVSNLIDSNSKYGSWDVCEKVLSCLRLANFQNRKLDMTDIWKVYYMYYNRKDYTVSTLPDALVVFEKMGLIKEEKSACYLVTAMNQSEKGIRHIFTEYVSKKDDSFIDKLQKNGELMSFRQFCLLDLPPQKINLFSEINIRREMNWMISQCRYSGMFDFNELENILLSNYVDLALNEIAKCGYKVINVPISRKYLFDHMNLDLELIQTKETRTHLKDGFVNELDVDYLIENDYSPIEIAQYQGGWAECLPIIEIFSRYDYHTVRTMLLEIIHTSMYARNNYSEYLGTWFNYLGYIPVLLSRFEPDTDWNGIYEAFTVFMECSAIYPCDTEKSI